MRNVAYAGVFASTMGLFLSNPAQAEPEIAILQCTVDDRQNSEVLQAILDGDPAVTEGVKQIAKGIKRITKGKKPPHPYVIFFKVLFTSKPAY